MTRVWPTAMALLCLSLFAPDCFAEQGVLEIHVSDTRGAPISGLILATRGPGSVGAPTTRDGKVRLQLQVDMAAGAWIALQIVGCLQPNIRWAFISPWDGRVLVPPYSGSGDGFVPIVVAEAGNRELLTSGDALEAIVTSMLARTAQSSGPIPSNTATEILQSTAAQLGFTPEQVDTAIRNWTAQASTDYRKGLSSLYEQKFADASEGLRKALTDLDRKVRAAKEQVYLASYLLAYSLIQEGDYAGAITALGKSLESRPNDLAAEYELAIAYYYTDDSATAARILNTLIDRVDPNADDLQRVIYVNSQTTYGLIKKRANLFGEARHAYGAALEQAEKVFGPTSATVGLILNNLGELERADGKLDTAERDFHRALTIFEDNKNDVALYRVISLCGLAAVYEATGRKIEADALTTQIAGMLEARLTPEIRRQIDEAIRKLPGRYNYESSHLSDRSVAEIWKPPASNLFLDEAGFSIGVAIRKLAVETQRETEAYTRQQNGALLHRGGLNYISPPMSNTMGLAPQIVRQIAAQYEAAFVLDEQANRLLAPDDPGLPELYLDMAQIRALGNRTQEASAYYKRAVQSAERSLVGDDERLAEVLGRSANFFAREGWTGDNEGAEYAAALFGRQIEVLERYTGSGTRVLEQRHELVLWYARWRHSDKAISYGLDLLNRLEVARSRGELRIDTLKLLGELYYEDGDSQAAIHYLVIYASEAPDPSEGSLSTLAEAYEKSGRYQEAEDVLRRIVNLKSEDDPWKYEKAGRRYELARFLERRKQLAEAANVLEDTRSELGWNSLFDDHYELLASIYVRLGRLTEAEGIYEKLVKDSPWREEYELSLGEVYLMRGERAKSARIVAELRSQGWMKDEDRARLDALAARLETRQASPAKR